MKLRDNYDWIVLGDHPAALLSAALAAKLGLMTLILPLSDSATIPNSSKGTFVDLEPNLLLGFRPLNREGVGNGLLGQCLGRLGILTAEEELFLFENRIPQILTPDARWPIGSAFESPEAALNRELGEEGRKCLREYQLESAWQRAREEYPRFWSLWPERLTLDTVSDPKGNKVPRARATPMSVGEFRKKLAQGERSGRSWFDPASRLENLKHLTGGTRAYELLRGAWAALSASDSPTPSQAELLQLLCMAHTAGSFRGGTVAYRDFLKRLARRCGANILEKAACVRVFVDNGRFTGVQSSQSGQMIGGTAGIIGTSLERLSPNVLEKNEKRTARARKLAPIRGWRFSLAVYADERAVPPGMGFSNVWQEADGPALTIERADPVEYGYRKPGFAVFFLRTILPYDPVTLTEEYLGMTSARMLRKLLEIVPFLEYRIAHIFPDFRGPSPGDELRQVYRFDSLEEMPDRLIVYEGEGLGSNSGIDGLYLSGGQSYPEMGSIGPVVAAMESVALLAHRAGLAGPLA